MSPFVFKQAFHLALRSFAAAILWPQGARAELSPVFHGLELVEEIDCSQEPPSSDLFRQYPEDISRVEPVLGAKARTLPNDQPGLKYFAYRIGRAKGLQANSAYVLELDYPEDAPRSFFIIDQGAEITRGFHTGTAIGDALKARRVNNLPESLNLPLSHKYEKWQMLFHLHERYPDIQRPRSQEFPRDQRPADGFWVIIGQFEPENAPISKGAAVSRIRLCKAPAFKQYDLKLRFPPADLPRRHLFYREEMADSLLGKKVGERGLSDPNDWYVHKARLHRFLGMDTFCKDLLEYGANQGWDSGKFGGEKWVPQFHLPGLWNGVVKTANEYGLNILPYYEYSGSKGSQGLGVQRRSMPLAGGENYTPLKWMELARADLTEPDTFEDLRKMLEITIAGLKDCGPFLGAWLRPRAAQLAISFSDAALERFAKETDRANPVTRPKLLAEPALYLDYKRWWFGKRKEFLTRVSGYVREASGNPEAVLLYTADPFEPGRPHPDPRKNGLVAEDPEQWRKIGIQATPLEVAVADRRQFEALTLPAATPEGWEWQHAAPEYDPENYRESTSVLPTFTFGRAWTVADPKALAAFRTRAGLAMIRQSSLNEDMFREDTSEGPKDPLGFFVCDMELAGPYCLLAEARAMANGDPRFLGYQASSTFNRGFPQYVRDFNAAFLSLPALPGELLENATTTPEIAVRRFDAGKHGVYYAIVNTGYVERKARIRFRENGEITNAATAEKLGYGPRAVDLTLRPCQLLALHILPPARGK